MNRTNHFTNTKLVQNNAKSIVELADWAFYVEASCSKQVLLAELLDQCTVASKRDIIQVASTFLQPLSSEHRCRSTQTALISTFCRVNLTKLRNPQISSKHGTSCSKCVKQTVNLSVQLPPVVQLHKEILPYSAAIVKLCILGFKQSFEPCHEYQFE